MEVDSLLPPSEPLMFLTKGDTSKFPYRLRTTKLRGALSQGLVMGLDELGIPDLSVDTDVTESLGIIKYEPPSSKIGGDIKGTFPVFIPKTDEPRIQTYPEVLAELGGKSYYITEKADGTSATYYWYNSEFGVCSRNNEMKDGDNIYWYIAKKYNLGEKMGNHEYNMAIQGEICGPGIQKNRLALKSPELFVFNVYDIDSSRYMDYQIAEMYTSRRGLQFVRLVAMGCNNFNLNLEELLELAKGTYPGTHNQREGIVVRTLLESYSEILKGRASFKVLNNDYLLGED